MKYAYILLLSLPAFLFSCQSSNTTRDGGMEATAAAMTESESEILELWSLVKVAEANEQSGELVNLAGNYALSGDGGYYFQLELTQSGDSLFGSYCGGNNSQVDCGMPSQGVGNCEVRGLVRNGVGHLAFRSCHTGNTGTAEIHLVGQHLRWKTTTFPEGGEFSSFCAAPSSSVLKNKHAVITYSSPARFGRFSVNVPDYPIALPEADSHFVFGEARVLQEPGAEYHQTILNTGKPVKILREADSYVISRIGDELFEAPVYEVAYEEYGQQWTGYVLHGDLATASFQDDRGNLFLLGQNFDEENPDLEWRIVGDAIGVKVGYVGIPAMKELLHYRLEEYSLSLQSRPELATGPLAFFELTLTANWRDRFVSQILYAWDGESLQPVISPRNGLFPRNMKTSVEDALLTVSYQLGLDPADEGRVTQRFELIGDSIVAETSQGVDGLFLAFAGEGDSFVFPDEYESKTWTQVYVDSGRVQIASSALNIDKTEVEDELLGSFFRKEISAEVPHPIDFMFAGLKTEPGESAMFEEEAMIPGSINPIEFSGVDWALRNTGSKSEYNGEELGSLLLTGTRDGNRIIQIIDEQPFRETLVECIWAGDLDGDNYPDFIVNVAPKGFYTDTRLYLSGLAQPGQLVGYAGNFLSPESGS